jgi:uncharacterized membrane protein
MTASLRPVDAVLPEELISQIVDALVRLVEGAGAIVIFSGVAIAFVRFLWTGLRERTTASFVPVRLDLGRFLALGLEFQLAGDVLRTAIAPTFVEIGQLAAVAAIRTALNYFLAREITAERSEIADRERDRPRPAAGTLDA